MADHRWYGRICLRLSTFLTRLIYRPRVRRADASEHRGVIYYSNHVSVLDAPILYQALGGVCGLAAKDWYDKPLLTPVFRQADVIPVNRYGMDTQWLRKSMEKLREGKNLLIFPEGHVRKDGGTDPFQPGFLMLARYAGAPLIPVWHPRYRAFRKTPVFIGEPVQIPREKLSGAEQKRLCAELREGLLQLSPDYAGDQQRA